MLLLLRSATIRQAAQHLRSIAGTQRHESNANRIPQTASR
ncbi:hypothetical protein PLANPX_5470 [Lacipirellula parvula]|uniref:Uncharacterized protein n=1 Tax=Lacipirellula parvula TaxID=2650471 RepID=A0A5K7XHE0_9BACT|nr:hypothetical protein PLANPX_5470 [Lacipirellula parvula]